jgi:hypothetical protein
MYTSSKYAQSSTPNSSHLSFDQQYAWKMFSICGTPALWRKCWICLVCEAENNTLLFIFLVFKIVKYKASVVLVDSQLAVKSTSPSDHSAQSCLHHWPIWYWCLQSHEIDPFQRRIMRWCWGLLWSFALTLIRMAGGESGAGTT